MTNIPPPDQRTQFPLPQVSTEEIKHAQTIVSPETSGIKSTSEEGKSRTTADLSPEEAKELSQAKKGEQAKAAKEVATGRVLGGHVVRTMTNDNLSSLAEKVLPHTKREP